MRSSILYIYIYIYPRDTQNLVSDNIEGEIADEQSHGQGVPILVLCKIKKQQL